MATCRRILNLAKKKRCFLYRSRKFYSTSVEVQSESSKSGEIIVPYRIHRGPTDILKALASTISKDFSAPQYKYEDDPFFIPPSNVTKRAFALSKESGRKAARYILEKYPELFVCNESVPHIKAFHPPIVYTTENVLSLDVLIECIKNYEVDNSVTVYKILKEKGVTVTQEVKQDLLELLCFHNGVQPPDEDYYEERYFKRYEQREKWNAKGEAERLFDEMEKDSKAYGAIIAGAAKFQDSERAHQLFEEMGSKNLIPTVEAYNSMISVIPWMRERRDSGCEYAMFLLGQMKKDGLVPNLYTMNAVLEVFVKRKFRHVNEMALAILSEMKRLNIEPSLGTYSLILSLFLDEYNNKLGVLYEIIDIIEGKELTVRHPLDVTFFTSAMEKCYKVAADKELAYRINKIVEFGNNSKLLGHAISESVYFKNFLTLLCETEGFDKFMEIYNQYVPNTYSPEPSLMDDVLRTLQFTGEYHYLPKLCHDVLVFEQTERENILSLALETSGHIKHEKKVQGELVEVIWKILQKLNRRLKMANRYGNFNWTGQLLGHVLNTFVNGNDVEKSWAVMEQLVRDEASIIGPPAKESLLNFCELVLEMRDFEKVKFCVKYAVKEAFPDFVADVKALAEDMFEKEKIDPKYRPHVKEFFQSLSYASVNETLRDSYSSVKDLSSSDSHSSNETDPSSSDSSSDLSSDSSSDSSSSDEEDNK